MSENKFISQPYLSPETYFSETPVNGNAITLWAIHTKPRAEKKLVQFLQMYEINHYLPTSLRRHVYGAREPRWNWIPLFPGYVFILQEDISRSVLYRSNSMVKIIPIESPKELYQDLRNVWLALTHKPTEVELSLYKPGSPVEVRSGPMRGVIGEILKTKNKKTRLVIRVRLFERAVSVDIDAGCVRPI